MNSDETYLDERVGQVPSAPRFTVGGEGTLGVSDAGWWCEFQRWRAAGDRGPGSNGYIL
jgi:hypothetical protein